MLYLILLILFVAGLYYVEGMLEYAKLNCKNSDEEELTLCHKSYIDEKKEFFEEVKNKRVIGALLEFSDMVHAYTKYAIVCWFGYKVLYNAVPYVSIFILCPWCLPTTIKHAYRYFIHRCIRSHKNGVHHNCYYR